MTTVYLDHNATTPMDARVRDAMLPWFSRPANASSVHGYGHAAQEAVTRARQQVAQLVGASADEVVFTSGGTESNNLALRGLLRHRKGGVVISAVEHAAVREPTVALGRDVFTVGVRHDGTLELDDLKKYLAKAPALASIMWANNETGVVNDIPLVASMCREAGVPLHTDAVQAAGKVVVDFRRSGVSMLTLSAHKLYGPQGVGALVVDRRLTLDAQQVGGGQEGGLRGGTEPVAAIVGFGVAAELATERLQTIAEHMRALRDRLEAGLVGMPRVTVLGQGAPRLPNTVQFMVSEVNGEALLLSLDQAGFAVSSGSACASGRREPSHVLLAMGVDIQLAGGVVRVSFGAGNTEAEVDALLEALHRLLQSGSLLAGGGAMGGW